MSSSPTSPITNTTQSVPKDIMSSFDFCCSVKDGFENLVSNPSIKSGYEHRIMKHDGFQIPLEKEDFILKVEEMSKSEVIQNFRTGKFSLSLWSSCHYIKGGTCLIINIMKDGIETGTIIMPMTARITGANFVFRNDKICTNDHKKQHYGLCSYDVSHYILLPSVEYELPEKCIMLCISGHYKVPYCIDNYIKSTFDRE